ncbi:MAG: prepilin peptidase [Lachnospiraceae bacterium]|nr:prepilin peptidase [Lachnospiraceae bacterium]
MTLQRIGTVIMLTAGSIWDIRGKRLPAGLLILDVLAGGILMAVNREIDWWKDGYLYVVGILIGILLLLVGRFCGGCIGAADGIMTAVIGGVIGYQDTLLLLMNAILAAAVFSIVLIVIKKARRGTTIPFIPFLLLGYLMILISI